MPNRLVDFCLAASIGILPPQAPALRPPDLAAVCLLVTLWDVERGLPVDQSQRKEASLMRNNCSCKEGCAAGRAMAGLVF
jgi:hypothetical protein